MMDIQQYINENKQRFLEELFGLLRIPSISSGSKHKKDLHEAAKYWQTMLQQAGAERADILDTPGNPVVYAEKKISNDLPTILVYAHYDVMPVEPESEWDTKPFEPEIKNGKIYCRGADDDKGQGFIHAKAFEYLVATNNLPCNVKFIIEGEEEVGSEGFIRFLKKNTDLLKADVILVSDTSMLSADTPSITAGLRGIAYFQVDVTGPNRDLHSGLYGGAVANPANVLSNIISSLTNKNGEITIPGFYNDVIQFSDEQRKEINKAPFHESEFKQSIGVKQVHGEKNHSTLERIGIRPSLDVNGIWSGYTGDGSKTVLPSTAHAKISMRLVPNQNPEEIEELFANYIMSVAPDTVKVEVKYLHGGNAYISPTDSHAYLAASKAIEKVFGAAPVPVFSGGSIPVIAAFDAILGVNALLMGFGLESDAIHSANENFPVSRFLKGIETVVNFYHYFSSKQQNKS